MDVESKCIDSGIFEIHKKKSEYKTIITKRTKGIILKINDHNIHFDSYFIRDPKIKACEKTIPGIIFHIKSKKGYGNIEFPMPNIEFPIPTNILPTKSLEEYLLKQEVEWDKEVSYSQKDGGRKVSVYNLHILTGALKNRRFTKRVEQ